MSVPDEPQLPGQNPFRSPAEVAPPSRRRSSWVWLLVGALVVAPCLCGGICLLTAGTGVYLAWSEREPVEEVLNEYLTHVEKGQVNEAVTLTSVQALSSGATSVEEVENLATSDSIRGFQAVHVNSINVGKYFSSDKKQPQGTVARVSGTVDYKDAPPGQVEATLDKEEGTWRVFSLSIRRPAPKQPAEE